MRLPNQNPNELAGSEVRPQPPHCDKNSYILESPPFQCCGDNKTQEVDRQPVFLPQICGWRIRKNPDFICVIVAKITSDINPPWVFDAEKISELAIVVAIVNDEVGDFTPLQ